MKNILQNFAVLFVAVYIVCNLAGFHKCFGRIYRAQSGHPVRACLPHWRCRAVLPDGLILRHFSKITCNSTCLRAEKKFVHTENLV